jgi:AraC-like DNA-binding protein
MWLQLLITIGVSQALILAILLLLKRNKQLSDYLLSLELGLLFIIILLYNYRLEFHEIIPNLSLNALVLGHLALPVFYLYVKAASQQGLNLSWRQGAMHLLPFAFASLLFTVNYHWVPFDMKGECLLSYTITEVPWWLQVIYFGLFLVVIPFYTFLSFKVLRAHEDYILTKFSYTEDVDLGWLNRFLWGLIVAGGLFVFFEVLCSNLIGWPDHQFGILPGFVVLIGMVIYLGIYGLRQNIIFLDPPILIQEPPPVPAAEGIKVDANEEKYASSALTDDKAADYLLQLQHYMTSEKPYLEPRITIGELAHRLQIPTNYLSQIINDQLDQNFFDFINSYRVEEFKNLVVQSENQQFTLLSLAYDAGFNSKSTFNAIFKKSTGYTPSEYAKMARQQVSELAG